MTAPYRYDRMLDSGATYVCSDCDSTFESDRYLCPRCGTLTLERRSEPTES